MTEQITEENVQKFTEELMNEWQKLIGIMGGKNSDLMFEIQTDITTYNKPEVTIIHHGYIVDEPINVVAKGPIYAVLGITILEAFKNVREWGEDVTLAPEDYDEDQQEAAKLLMDTKTNQLEDMKALKALIANLHVWRGYH